MSQLANNPMRCTTADTFPLKVFKHWCQIHHFEFQNAAAGDTVTVQDLLGNTVWDTTAPTDTEAPISQLIGDCYGLTVSAFSSAGGELLIYFR